MEATKDAGRLPDDLAAAKQRVLTDVFGFDGFRRGQENVVDRLLRGRSILTVMPTGSGKSLCFQVPALVLGGLTVVVSPLVALMQDQVAALQLAGVAAGAINSARSRADNVETWRRAAAGTLRLLYMAPERLMTERMLAALRKLPVRLLVVDEAHCISQWGPAFRPEYQDLSRLKEIFPDVPIAALTATADRVTRQDVMERLFNAAGDCLVLGFDRPNIRLSVTPKQNPSAQLLHFMAEHRGENGIVYCLSRKKTESTAALLNGTQAAAAAAQTVAVPVGLVEFTQLDRRFGRRGQTEKVIRVVLDDFERVVVRGCEIIGIGIAAPERVDGRIGGLGDGGIAVCPFRSAFAHKPGFMRGIEAVDRIEKRDVERREMQGGHRGRITRQAGGVNHLFVPLEHGVGSAAH